MAAGYIIQAEVKWGCGGWQTMYYCGECREAWSRRKERARVYRYVGWANARRDWLARGLVEWIRWPVVESVEVGNAGASTDTVG